MTELLLTFLIVLIVFAVVWAILIRLPLPEPFGWIAQVILLLLLLLVLVTWLIPPLTSHALLR
jgi:hypothetical protein